MISSKINEAEVCIVAAEASSALYAERLLESWLRQNFKVRTFGIGNRAMEKLGFECLGRSEELAVVGIAEVVRHYSKIKSVFYDIIKAVEVRRPKVILLLDYPDFNLRLAKELKKFDIPIVYYISPQIWAWRKSRIKTIQKYINRMLVVLPFEKDFYLSYGVEVDFVGHPLLDEIKNNQMSEVDRQIERKRYGIRESEILVGLMPGSRRSELKNHLAEQIAAADLVYEQNKNVKFAILVAPSFSIEELKTYLPPYNLPIQIIQDEPLKMVSLTDVVLCASGTATLIVGLLLKPMVIMYKMNFFSAWLAKMFVRGTRYFGLINLILNDRVVPELFQQQANAKNLAVELLKFINDKDLRDSTIEKLKRAHSLLGQEGATDRVSEILIKMIKNENTP